ncbi:integrase [Sphingomonas crocodyli]|uniref:integrase n=1 Tax=Sphingomonas crocodyli TaxID=1979270 RepID=UPI001F0CB1EA|nr:integrase [Sphingomonas crocodyli]
MARVSMVSVHNRAAKAIRTLDDVVDAVTVRAAGDVLVDRDLIRVAVRAWAPNTIRAFLSDLVIWDDWCRRSALQLSEATPETTAAFIRALAGVDVVAGIEVRAAATIARYLVNIGWAYRMVGIADPTNGPLVSLELKAARRVLGTRQRQARALRFKGDVAELDAPAAGLCITHLLKACRRDLMGDRDRALLLVAYDTGFRRSELVGIDVADIEGPDVSGAGTVELGRSKTDQVGEGAFAYLSPVTMRAILRWRDAGHIDAGALFRRVETHFDGSVRTIGREALHPNSISFIYKRLTVAAWEKGLLGPIGEAERDRLVAAVSSHSIRVGVAQDNVAAGEAMTAIMQAYRWRDPRTVMRYGARLAAKSGAAARMAARMTGAG